MLVKNLFHQIFVAIVLSFCLFLFSQCNSNSCNLTAPTLTTSNITASSAKVSWGTLNTAPAEDYQVELIDAATNTVLSSTTTTSTTFTFTGLNPNKSYKTRVTPRCDSSNPSPNQSSVDFTTLSPACNLAAPTNLNIVPLSISTVKLSWTDVQGAANYQVTVFDSTTNTSRMFMIPPPPTMTLDSLVGGHKYSISVAAKCPNGEVSPNLIIRGYKPYIIIDDIIMFSGKLIGDNCALDTIPSALTNGQTVSYAPFNMYGTNKGSSFLIKASHSSGTADIRIIYEETATKIMVSAGLNCTNYTLPKTTEKVVSKTISTAAGDLSVTLDYRDFVVNFNPSVGTIVTLQRKPR